MSNSKYIYLFICLLLVIFHSNGDKILQKKQDKKNVASHKVPTQRLESLERPFRMAKLNIAWARAQKALSDVNLKSFYADMKIQDKEMFEWKHTDERNEARSEDLRQSQYMNKLAMVMEKYGLLNIDETKQEFRKKKAESEKV